MAKEKETEVSMGYWMFAVLITATPLVNLILVPILAFAGGNPTKRNYYRAVIALFVLLILFHVILILVFGLGPELLRILDERFLSGE